MKWAGCSLNVSSNPASQKGAAGCRKAAENRVRAALGGGAFGVALGCALEVIGSSEELASTKGLPPKLAKKVMKANLYFMGALCIKGGLGV